MTAEEAERIDSHEFLKEIIREFLHNHNYIHEYRLQKLVYLALLRYIEKREKPLIPEIDYKPYMYGAFSEDVREAVEELAEEGKVPTEKQYRYGEVKTMYRDGGESSELSEDIKSLVKATSEVTRNKSNEDLAQWSKSTYLFENTDYNEEMEFEEYVEKVQTSEIEPDAVKIKDA